MTEGNGLENLGGGCYAAVSNEHRFGTDAFLLSDFICPKKEDRAADLGTGCGIIPLLWHRRKLCKSIVGLELSTDGAALAKQGVSLSGAEEKITILNSDLREHRRLFAAASFDLVACNPPYKALGAGIPSATPSALSARHEHTCTLDDVCRAASFMLRYGGRFGLCHRPERLTDLLTAMRHHGLEPKRLRMVMQRPDKAPWLVLVEGRRSGRNGLALLPPLYMEDEKGNKTEELQKIYKGWDEQ